MYSYDLKVANCKNRTKNSYGYETASETFITFDISAWSRVWQYKNDYNWLKSVVTPQVHPINISNCRFVRKQMLENTVMAVENTILLRPSEAYPTYSVVAKIVGSCLYKCAVCSFFNVVCSVIDVMRKRLWSIDTAGNFEIYETLSFDIRAVLWYVWGFWQIIVCGPRKELKEPDKCELNPRGQDSVWWIYCLLIKFYVNVSKKQT